MRLPFRWLINLLFKKNMLNLHAKLIASNNLKWCIEKQTCKIQQGLKLDLELAFFTIQSSKINFLKRIIYCFKESLRINTENSLKTFIQYCKQQDHILLTRKNKNIRVSIIVPVYNKWHYTRVCINSILASSNCCINYEIILADDCSTDETINAGTYYPNIVIIRTDKNVGFLRNCNNAVKYARGDYIVLLNNDTVVLPNWLSSLYNTMEANNSTAIVGSKILHANGLIQAAGAVIFSEGSVSLIGSGFHRLTPMFNVERETHYISGCSIMIRKSFWNTVGGFDGRYQIAYYEDTDLAMMAHLHGMRVVYQPESEIIHFGSRSYKTIAKKLCRKNAQLFLDKWAGLLPQKSHWPLS